MVQYCHISETLPSKASSSYWQIAPDGLERSFWVTKASTGMPRTITVSSGSPRYFCEGWMHNWRKSIHQNGLHEFINWIQRVQKSSNVFFFYRPENLACSKLSGRKFIYKTIREMHLMIYFARIKSINDSLSRRHQILVNILWNIYPTAKKPVPKFQSWSQFLS